MAILFCGIVMSHYAHFNLSPVTQITVQQLFRTAAFLAGRCRDLFYYISCVIPILSFMIKFTDLASLWIVTFILTEVGRGVNFLNVQANFKLSNKAKAC